MTMLKASDVAKLLNISEGKVYRLAGARQLASYKIGNSLRFSQEDVDEFLKDSYQPAMVYVQPYRYAPPQKPNFPGEHPLTAYFKNARLRKKR